MVVVWHMAAKEEGGGEAPWRAVGNSGDIKNYLGMALPPINHNHFEKSLKRL